MCPAAFEMIELQNWRSANCFVYSDDDDVKSNPLSSAAIKFTKMIKLYGMWRSSATWRVRNVLHFHGIPYEYQEVDLLKGENYQPDYTALNPAQRVPLMVFTKECGEQVKMAESQSICEFLDTYTRRE